MPRAFVHCANTGGRIRTIARPGGKYMHVCFKGGKSFAGEMHTKKKQPRRHRKRQATGG